MQRKSRQSQRDCFDIYTVNKEMNKMSATEKVQSDVTVWRHLHDDYVNIVSTAPLARSAKSKLDPAAS